MSLNDLWKLAPIAISMVVLCLMPLKEGDLWWNLLAGGQIIQTGQIPQNDFMTFTAGEEPANFYRFWLSELLLAGLYKSGGLSAQVLVQALIGTTVILIILAENLKVGASPRLAGSMALLALLGLSTFSSTRPQIFSFLCFAVLYWALSETQQGGRKRLWLIPLVMFTWVNLHPGWSIGVLLLSAWLALDLIKTVVRKEPLRKLQALFLWGAAGFLALLFNPQGWGILDDPISLASNPIIQRYISEWQPASLTMYYSWPLYLMSALLFMSLAFSRKRPGFQSFFLLMIFLAFSLRYVRMIPFWIILATPLIAELASGLSMKAMFALPETSPEVKPSPRTGIVRINQLIAVLLVLAVLLSLPAIRLALKNQPETALVGAYFPNRAADYLKSLPEDELRLFSKPEWGGYLAWRLSPAGKVFVDGRIELFPNRVWADYLLIASAAPDWLERLGSYRVDYLVLSKETQAALIKSARQSGLICPFEDEIAVLCKAQIR